jgi:ubiquinone/menaquinone biosynthesis C-methylase UbiE
MEVNMPKDKSLFHYGVIYSVLIDPLMASSHTQIISRVPKGATVLDIGCGTGKLCFKLRQKKACRITGIDLSLRMLNFAKVHNRFADVCFQHQDATDMVDVADDSFDLAIICYIIHELHHPNQIKLINEAWRVSRSLVLVESSAPLPWNAVGLVKRLIEYGFGWEHTPQFRQFVEGGGLLPLLTEAGLSDHITSQDKYQARCNQIIVVSK